MFQMFFFLFFVESEADVCKIVVCEFWSFWTFDDRVSVNLDNWVKLILLFLVLWNLGTIKFWLHWSESSDKAQNHNQNSARDCGVVSFLICKRIDCIFQFLLVSPLSNFWLTFTLLNSNGCRRNTKQAQEIFGTTTVWAKLGQEPIWTCSSTRS